MTATSTLAEHFAGAAGKYLSAVEAHPVRSNQHEFNGVAGLRALLGEPPVGGRTFTADFVFLDDDMEAIVADSTLTWYDARAAHPTRSEHRLYYPNNPVLEAAAEGDYMVLARPSNANIAGELVVIVSPAHSTVATQLQQLFGLEPSDRLDIEVEPSDEDLTFASRLLLEALGFEAVPLQENYLEKLLSEFGEEFPATARFSSFARSTLIDVDGRDDPDGALVLWMNQEESLYRTLERHVVAERLAAAGGDVDMTLEIAMQTFQRRRSRAGHALENHVAEVLHVNGVRFDQQATTEGRKRPDFLFPGRAQYQNPEFPNDRLFMLGVKTTCKDRWRQVLTEADRIPRKHLLTLEAPISPAQTDEMLGRSLRLVLPSSLHSVFEPMQQRELVSVQAFVREVQPK